MLTVYGSDKQFEGHYTHFCKQILWPVFHYQMSDSPKSRAFEDHSWKHYVRINEAFANKIIQKWKPGDVVWVHDYHLLLVPGMIRKRLPGAKIGFFLHVAFPSSEVFRCLPVRSQLLEGVLGADLVGFQTSEYARHFLHTCRRVLGAETTDGGLQLGGRFVSVVSLAVGIDPLSLNQNRSDERVMGWIRVMQERYQDVKLIVARDKLDHVRGIRQKLLAYERFLEQNPQRRDRTVLIQVVLPTREGNDLDASISAIVSRVNSRWANLAFQPIVYLKKDLDHAQYLALLTMADALMVTSQREGMNLTSHEYVLCQGGQTLPDRKYGPVIMSEFTGTSSLFKGDAITVNPWDCRQCAEAIGLALDMGEQEKEHRWSRLSSKIGCQTGSYWVGEFLNQLDQVHGEQLGMDLDRVLPSQASNDD